MPRIEYHEVDEHGKRVDVHNLDSEEQVPSNYMPGWGDRIFYDPIWDFSSGDWKEGKTPEEIYNLTKPKPTPPSDAERMDALEFILMEMMMKQQMQEMMDMQQPDLKL